MRTLMTMLSSGALVLVMLAPAVADWNEGDGHKMHWPQLPDPTGWDVAISPLGAVGSLADDWRCSQSGPVADIHFWVSFQQWSSPDAIPPIQPFTIRIREDIPDPDGPTGSGYSMPGTMLWERKFDPYDPTTTSVRHYGTGEQGWLDPWSGVVAYPDHTEFYQINLAGFDDPFYQELGKIYWLEVEMVPGTSGYPIGWKTSRSEHFNDDAVFGTSPDFWNPMRDPRSGESLDLAFVITPEPATLAFVGLGGLFCLRRNRRR